MDANAYEILALAMRYVFAALIVLIVLRAWRITAIDGRRARKLRRLSPDTGIIGEMLVVDGGERARTGMRYPVTLEGTIGSNRRADIRVRHSSVRGRHAFYQMTEEGFFVRGHASARIRDGAGRSARELMLGDGDVLQLGAVKLMLVLSEGGAAPEEIVHRAPRRRPEGGRAAVEPEEMDDGIFEVSPRDAYDPDDLFMDSYAGDDSDPTEDYDRF